MVGSTAQQSDKNTSPHMFRGEMRYRRHGHVKCGSRRGATKESNLDASGSMFYDGMLSGHRVHTTWSQSNSHGCAVARLQANMRSCIPARASALAHTHTHTPHPICTGLGGTGFSTHAPSPVLYVPRCMSSWHVCHNRPLCAGASIAIQAALWRPTMVEQTNISRKHSHPPESAPNEPGGVQQFSDAVQLVLREPRLVSNSANRGRCWPLFAQMCALVSGAPTAGPPPDGWQRAQFQ